MYNTNYIHLYKYTHTLHIRSVYMIIFKEFIVIRPLVLVIIYSAGSVLLRLLKSHYNYNEKHNNSKYSTAFFFWTWTFFIGVYDITDCITNLLLYCFNFISFIVFDLVSINFYHRYVSPWQQYTYGSAFTFRVSHRGGDRLGSVHQ